MQHFYVGRDNKDEKQQMEKIYTIEMTDWKASKETKDITNGQRWIMYNVY